MTNRLIETTEKFVRDRLGTEGTGHDWWHAHRVRNTSRSIFESEGGDPLVIELASLLHDVGDRKVIGREEDDPTIAHDFLREQELGAMAIQSVMNIIEHMSFSKSLDGPVVEKSIELQIVQDADRLDAIGAIGIARAFAFGGSRQRLLYDPDATAQVFTSSDDYKKATGSTFHHFEEKLLHIKDGLNTATARRIAEERDEYMRDFLDQFLHEWDGKR